MGVPIPGGGKNVSACPQSLQDPVKFGKLALRKSAPRAVAADSSDVYQLSSGHWQSRASPRSDYLPTLRVGSYIGLHPSRLSLCRCLHAHASASPLDVARSAMWLRTPFDTSHPLSISALFRAALASAWKKTSGLLLHIYIEWSSFSQNAPGHIQMFCKLLTSSNHCTLQSQVGTRRTGWNA
eukprot:1657156-Amphidinium_carterae.1